MVRVKYSGRLGNQLFQYCAGRLLAEKLGYALEAPEIKGLRCTSEPVEGHDYSLNIYPRHVYRHTKDFDLWAIAADETKRLIELDGFFQHAKHYVCERERIKKWLADVALERRLRVRADDLLVSVRTGDFWELGWVLDFSYYEALLEKTSRGRVFILSDDFEDAYISQFARYRPILLDKITPITQLAVMRQFSRIAMSNSTFCWWGAFMSQAEEVYFPVMESPHTPDNFNYWNDLHVPGWTRSATSMATNRYVDWEAYGL